MMPRGFTLMEAMTAMTVAGVLLFGTLSTYNAAQHARADARHEWVAFTLAQSQLELLASTSGEHPRLADTADDVVVPGATDDAQCASGVDGRLSDDMAIDELGQPRPDAAYQLCWKVTAGNPFGSLKNIRVVVGFPAALGTRHVLLQTIR